MNRVVSVQLMKFPGPTCEVCRYSYRAENVVPMTLVRYEEEGTKYGGRDFIVCANCESICRVAAVFRLALDKELKANGG